MVPVKMCTILAPGPGLCRFRHVRNVRCRMGLAGQKWSERGISTRRLDSAALVWLPSVTGVCP